MSCIFLEGWDKYGPNGITNNALVASLVQGEWTSVQINFGFVGLVAGLSATGYALQIGNNSINTTNVYKTLPTFYTRIIGGFRFASSLGGTAGLVFSDGGTAQCSISINTTGTLSVRSGSFESTILTTSITSVTSNSIHYCEFDITIGSSATYQVWLDGLSIINSIGNTQAGTAFNRINGIMFIVDTNEALTVDDLYLFSSSGATSNAVLLTNPRIETQFPTGDTQTQFTNNASVLGNVYSATSSTNAPGANTLFVRQYTPEVNITLNSVSCVPQATSSAKFKAVAYTDSGGSPHNLLSTGGEVFGTITGNTLTSTLGTPQSLTGGTPYWIGFITDSSVLLAEQDTTITGVRVSNTYIDGAPGTLSGMTTGLPSWEIWGNCTGATTNWSSLNSNPAPGNLSYVSSATVGVNDLYSFASLTTTPTHIYCVGVKGNVTRTDTGLRTVDMCIQSSTTFSLGNNSNVTPPTSFSWVGSYFDTDPNTGSAWTISALNSATAGPKVES